jgi:5'-3' exonuclease
MYDVLIVDSVNFGYRIFNDPEKLNQGNVIDHKGKRVYQRFISSMMEALRWLQATHLAPGGQVVLLFDNYHSRSELEKMLRPLKESQSRKEVNKSYKLHRKNAKIEFYNSLDLLRTWAFTAPPHIHTARIPNLEADDLVKPCLQYYRAMNPDAKILMATNDSDWCRYLDENTQYLPELFGVPAGVDHFLERFGFYPSEDRVVLYKILEGDDSDGVSKVFPEISPEHRRLIVSRYTSTLEFLFGVHSDPDLQEYSSLVKDKEVETKIAFQML